MINGYQFYLLAAKALYRLFQHGIINDAFVASLDHALPTSVQGPLVFIPRGAMASHIS
jgi:hypothetical protein